VLCFRESKQRTRPRILSMRNAPRGGSRFQPGKKLGTRDGHVCGRKRNARAVSAGGALALLRVDVNNAIVRKLGFTCMLSGNAPAISRGPKLQVRLQRRAEGQKYARVH